jgi:hypothetical protein
VRHRATRRFWQTYHALPLPARAIADKNFKLLKADLGHPSLHFKRIGRAYSVRVGLDYRALALPAAMRPSGSGSALTPITTTLSNHSDLPSTHRTFIHINHSSPDRVLPSML